MRKSFFCIMLGAFLNLLALGPSRIAFRSDAFFATSERFRNIYGDVSFSYQVEASTRLATFDGWLNFDFLSKHGKSEGFHNPTKVYLNTLSFGVKFPYTFSEAFTFYFGVGPTFSNVSLNNGSECSKEKVSKWSYGGVIKSGLYLPIHRALFLDLFLDYTYQPVNFQTAVDVGGLRTGLGVGVIF
jgi:hypothetical protein